MRAEREKKHLAEMGAIKQQMDKAITAKNEEMRRAMEEQKVSLEAEMKVLREEVGARDCEGDGVVDGANAGIGDTDVAKFAGQPGGGSPEAVGE